jgi:hypothetical protein
MHLNATAATTLDNNRKLNFFVINSDKVITLHQSWSNIYDKRQLRKKNNLIIANVIF